MNQDLKLEPYVYLLQEFLDSKVTAGEFERRYLRLFKSDELIRPEDVFDVLDALFADVDAFDPEGLIDEGLDETQLRDRVGVALASLRRFLDRRHDSR
jgi:Bacterial self-protective colicin-like immunity